MLYYFHANDQDYTFYTLEDAVEAAKDYLEVRKIRDTAGGEYFL